MQIYAYDIHNTLINVSQASRHFSYRCPECKHFVRVRGGSLRKLHFYHLQNSLCRLHGKSQTHLHIQHALQKMLGAEEVLLEQHFPTIGRVADVVWPTHKLIFEVQVSPISATEVKQRNIDYSKLGYQVIWILHDRQFNRFILSEAELILRERPHYFTNINAFGKGYFYDQLAIIRNKRRIRRSRQFPVRFKEIIAINLKQFSRQMPLARRKWPFAFSGDVITRQWFWQEPKKKSFSFLHILLLPYRIILHLLLEKTTY